MNNKIVKRSVLFLLFMVGIIGHIQAQINDSEVYFFDDYIVKFNYTKSTVYISHSNKNTIKAKLLSSQDYYENEKWTEDKTSDGGYVSKYQWDSDVQKYVFGKKVKSYNQNCAECRRNCERQRENAQYNVFPMGVDCEYYGCGKHGYAYYGYYSFLDFSSGMQEMRIQYSGKEKGTMEEMRRYGRKQKIDFKVNTTSKIPLNILLHTVNGEDVGFSGILNRNSPTIILYHDYSCIPAVRLQRDMEEVSSEWKTRYGVDVVVVYANKKIVPQLKTLSTVFASYFDDRSFFRSQFLDDFYIIHGMIRSIGGTPVLLFVNRANEVVDVVLGYNANEKEKYMNRIEEGLQKIK